MTPEFQSITSSQLGVQNPIRPQRARPLPGDGDVLYLQRRFQNFEWLMLSARSAPTFICLGADAGNLWETRPFMICGY